MDWSRLYIGRFFRLAPLYFVAAALMLTFGSFSPSVTPNVAQTTANHAAAPRRHPCASSVIATASISGTITA
jgi:peptidoglycan/LPS O-acetylase OafA/YrhL